MKRVNQLFFGSALALLAGASLTACSSSDDVTDAPVNPSYDGKSVKTQFAINIATPSNSKTRMSDVNTQNGGNFLGMSSIKLFPFSSEPGKNVTWTRNISLTNIDNGISSSASSKIYSNVEIPVGTNNFLFYGFGPMGGSTQDEKFQKGILTTSFPNEVATAPSNISVSLVSILGSTDMSTMQGYYTAYLNSIKNVTGWSTTDDVTLSDAYDKFTTIGLTGVRCGSASAILKTVELLYNLAIDRKESSTSTEVQSLAEAIKTAITPSSGDIQVTNTMRSDGKHYDLAYSSTDGKYNFPTNYGLPEGAAQLAFDGTDGFSYKNQPTIGATGSVLNVYGLTYPSSIAYTANTAAKASTEIFEANEWPQTVNAWDTESSWTGMGTWADVVAASTRSVALVNNINYSVASLKTTVKCNAASLEDNRAAVLNDGNTSNQTITVPNDGFKVTGVLVGGQPNKVDWQFLDNNSARNAVIYDKELSGIVAKSDAESSPNYTLVFDSWKGNGTQDDVLMAIELENNSNSDFYGVDGIILKGQKFYLVAKLAVASGTGSITWPNAAYRYPQSNTQRVFMQDYTTTAKLNIKSLKNAYSTIPDLRSVELQLGLSVDLTWQSGLTFEVPIE